MPPIFNNTLAMIGNTPLLAVRHIDTGPCELFLKLENQNPGGSIKDRVGLTVELAIEPPGTIERSAGKARRVIDRRPKG